MKPSYPETEVMQICNNLHGKTCEITSSAHIFWRVLAFWSNCAERGALNLHLNRNPLGLTVNALVSWRNLNSPTPALLSTYETIDFFYCCLIGRVSNSIALAVIKINRSRFCTMETATNFSIIELQSKHLVSFKFVFMMCNLFSSRSESS